jgi:hypothetical protein
VSAGVPGVRRFPTFSYRSSCGGGNHWRRGRSIRTDLALAEKAAQGQASGASRDEAVSDRSKDRTGEEDIGTTPRCPSQQYAQSQKMPFSGAATPFCGTAALSRIRHPYHCREHPSRKEAIQRTRQPVLQSD